MDKLQDGSGIRRGPYWLYTYKEGDKTKSKRLPDEDTARRYLEEIKRFLRFEEISKDLIGVSQQMCDLGESVGTRKGYERKKTHGGIFTEVQAELEDLIAMALRARAKEGTFDLEALELTVRDSLHRCAILVLRYLLSYEDGHSTGLKPCQCGGQFKNRKTKAKTLRTLLGPVRIQRIVQRCSRCGAWHMPRRFTHSSLC